MAESEEQLWMRNKGTQRREGRGIKKRVLLNRAASSRLESQGFGWRGQNIRLFQPSGRVVFQNCPESRSWTGGLTASLGFEVSKRVGRCEVVAVEEPLIAFFATSLKAISVQPLPSKKRKVWG